jgi:predicted aminopeptidase
MIKPALLNKRVPIEDVLKDPKIKPEIKRKLRLAQKAEQFAEQELGLKPTDNYESYVELNRPYVVYAVNASYKNRLEGYTWHFPIIGDVPYKGFFSLEDAKEEEKLLLKKNLDTYLRGVTAYSTLGWFDDPILSSMMSYSDHYLVETIIHETVHATIYIKDNADFNEQLASFLGAKGAEKFYLKHEGPDSKTLKNIKKEKP